MNPHEILIRPRVTEKSVFLQNEHRCYTFEVHQNANKSEIAKAVETLFKVTVTKITIQNRLGKLRRLRGREGYSANWKKAMVTVADGQRIEGV